jgi:hypothetical protein
LWIDPGHSPKPADCGGMREADLIRGFSVPLLTRYTPMPDQIKYAHHELDPVLMNGHEALIFVNGHWQGMCHSLALEAKLMSKDDFYRVFGMVADRVPATAWQTT